MGWNIWSSTELLVDRRGDQSPFMSLTAIEVESKRHRRHMKECCQTVSSPNPALRASGAHPLTKCWSWKKTVQKLQQSEKDTEEIIIKKEKHEFYMIFRPDKRSIFTVWSSQLCWWSLGANRINFSLTSATHASIEILYSAYEWKVTGLKILASLWTDQRQLLWLTDFLVEANDFGQTFHFRSKKL